MRYYLEYLNGILIVMFLHLTYVSSTLIIQCLPRRQVIQKLGLVGWRIQANMERPNGLHINMDHAEHCNLKMKQMVSSCVTFQLLPVNYPLFKIFTRKISFLWLLIIKYEEFCCKLQ